MNWICSTTPAAPPGLLSDWSAFSGPIRTQYLSCCLLKIIWTENKVWSRLKRERWRKLDIFYIFLLFWKVFQLSWSWRDADSASWSQTGLIWKRRRSSWVLMDNIRWRLSASMDGSAPLFVKSSWGQTQTETFNLKGLPGKMKVK